MKNPWKTRSTRTVYRNPWITVKEDRVIQPDGRPSIYGVIHARPYVGVVPLVVSAPSVLGEGGTNDLPRSHGHAVTRDRGAERRRGNTYVYLVRQWRYARNAAMWEIPTGGIHPGESPLQAAKRELAEEAGLVAKRWTFLGRMFELTAISTADGKFFVAQSFSPAVSQLDGSEADLVVKKFSWAQTLRWIDQGKIADGISVAALLKTDRWLHRRRQ